MISCGSLIRILAAETRTLMDKCRSSRKQHHWLFGRRACSVLLAVTLTISLWPHSSCAITLSHADVLRIGKRVWQNECNGTISGLTAWNEGEDFASLGIGHFIWYPKGGRGPFEESFPKLEDFASLGIGHFIWYPTGRRGPFEESFPQLVSFVSKRGAKLPTLLLKGADQPCPWNSRAEFLRAQHAPDMNQLRQFLAGTIDLQAEFLMVRLEGALPKMLAEAAPADRPNVQQQFERLTRTPQGCYGLIDYVNFKGEGVLHTERYQGQGWGLLQVLEAMHGTSDADAANEFARAAKATLIQRVHNAPAERHESKWLTGWIRRVNSYSGG